jgi:hypothetical protein
MVNHIRTLLLNQSAAGRPAPGQYGEEIIPAGYARRPELGDVVAAKRLLFGSDPDVLTQNIRAAQYLKLVHADPRLAPLVVAFDSRITYLNKANQWLFPEVGTTYTVTDGVGEAFVDGTWQGDDGLGRNMLRLVLAANAADGTLTVSRQWFAPQDASRSMSDVDIENRTAVPGATDLFYRLVGKANFTFPWRCQVDVLTRPARSLAQVSSQLSGTAGLLASLTAGTTEPFPTLASILRHESSNPLKVLAATVLAVAYRMEANG